ncbi:TonB-dependent siderophore receptor [Rhodovastum atsumiense]|uniref:TonB-dependent siderophore receptor n=1 Tax=Rhodovastum atsumiense TaxID=504468 RepID=A0A5M6IN17_9PROT|nr:TonB-dependent siderophore receptor [Rhodovastum atsumiense]KAA5609269.1 TonB-dependent siderophore receptor [Rhodovastum atsumiense]CAH2601725.1 TonB-dependent siderophore receptor [Rhodovastum atsumiense]
MMAVSSFSTRITSPGAALAAWLLGSGSALAQGADAPGQETWVDPVVVSAPPREASGGAGDGYRRARVDLGPLGNRPKLETPYSIQDISSPMMEAVGARTLSEAIRYFPSAQIEARGGLDVGRPQSRGFQGDIVQNTRMDGLNVFGVTAYPMEQLEAVELLQGLSGALYGPAAPAGTFNYILKRPTEEPLRKLSLGFDSAGIGTVHTDVGGQVARFGYRLNGLIADGTGYVGGSHLRREMVSGNFDLHVSDATTLELNASHYLQIANGYPGSFSYSQTTPLPAALDPTKVGYGQSFAGQQLETNIVSTRLRHSFSDDWSVTGGGLHQEATRILYGVTNTLASNARTYTSSISTNMSGTTTVDSMLLYLNGRVRGLGLTHDLMLGSNGFQQTQFTPRYTRSYTLGSASLYAPTVFNPPAWLDVGPKYRSGQNRQFSLIAGDTITFTERWSVLAAFSQDWLQGASWDTSGTKTSGYHQNGISPTASLMFRPLPDMMLYFTYADSLQKGDTAPTSGVANAGEILPPYRSEQFELGWKARMAAVDLAAALFRMTRPFAYTGSDNVFREQGTQVNYGLELSAKGNPVEDLTVFGGVTLLDPELTDTVSPATSGKLVVGVPRIQANLYTEYRVPALPGLALEMNLHHTGRRAANDTNTTWADAYTTLDLGARYATDLWGRDVTWRLGVKNLFDERYWVSVFPSSINGTNAGNASAFLGAPRTVWAALQVRF